MAKFLKNLFYFIFFIVAVIGIGIFIPPTPRAATAHLSSIIDKNFLLENTPSPRILLIGGSNLSMSLNSQLLKDSLQLNPVNTGLSASIGLLYMLDHTLRYVKAGDLVVVCPEYSQFYENLYMGTEDLLRVILDNSPADIFKLRGSQIIHGLKYLPKYSLSKFKLADYFPDDQEVNQSHVYLRTSFNKYGDMDKHWELPRREFGLLDPLRSSSFNSEVLDYLKQFKEAVEDRGAVLYLAFPALDEHSFNDEAIEIASVTRQLRESGFITLGDPERYRMPDSVMFDTPYHLTLKGVKVRTQLLIEDIKAVHQSSGVMSMTPLD